MVLWSRINVRGKDDVWLIQTLKHIGADYHAAATQGTQPTVSRPRKQEPLL